MKKNIEVVPYDARWPEQFELLAASIRETLGEHCLEVHHIGSTAVPGLSAKPKIDVMCVIDQLEYSFPLEKIGFEFGGEWNIPLRYGFRYRSEDLKVNLHVVEKDHGFIELNLTFRDYLRENDEARLEYDRLKYDLLQDPTSYERGSFGLPIYTLRKDALIKRFLERTGYAGLNLNFCAHNREWEEHHRILGTEISQNTEANHHFILYRGSQIIGAAHVEFLSETECALRSFAIDAPYQGKEYEAQMRKRLEKWLRQKGRKML